MELLTNLMICTLSHISHNFSSRCPAEGCYGPALSREQSGCVRKISAQIRAMGRLMVSDKCGPAMLKLAEVGDDMGSILHTLNLVPYSRPGAPHQKELGLAASRLWIV